MVDTLVANPLSAEPVWEARVAAILAPAGAFDGTPIEIPCPGFQSVRFYISYTLGADGGEVTFRIEISPYSADQAGVQDWFWESDTLLAAPVLAGGADSANLIQRQTHTYEEVTGAIEDFEYVFMLRRNVERIRIPCAESGVVGTPGTVHIMALFGM